MNGNQPQEPQPGDMTVEEAVRRRDGDFDVREADRAEREEQVVRAGQLLRQFEGDPEKLAMIAAQFWLAGQPTGDSLEFESMVSAATGEPKIQLKWGPQYGTMSPGKAREIALALLEAAEAAISDATFYEMLSRDGTQEDRENAAMAVAMLREAREKAKAKAE